MRPYFLKSTDTFLYHLCLVTRQSKSQHLHSTGAALLCAQPGGVQRHHLVRNCHHDGSWFMLLSTLGTGEMGRREAGGADHSPIAWTRVQIALMCFSARKIWAAAGQYAGMGQDLWDPGPALMLFQGVPDFLEGLNETPQKGEYWCLAV